jgi:hypothetical protein
MPGGDGTGPYGKAREAGGRGRRGAIQQNIAGPRGFCVCPSCGKKIPHVRGQPCSQVTCPQCGTGMARET